MASGTGYISRPTLYGQVYPNEDVSWVSTPGSAAHKLDGNQFNVGMGSAIDISFDTKIYFVGSKDFGGHFIGDNIADSISLGRFDILRYTPPGDSGLISNVFSKPLYTLIGTKGSGNVTTTWGGYDHVKYPDGFPSGELGASVKANWDGTRVVVGEPGWDANRVHVMTTSGTVVGNQDTRWASGTVSTAIIQGPTASEFGRSVAITKDAANIIVVGAPRLNKIYVYKAVSSTNWQLVYENGDTGISQKIRYDANTYYDMIPHPQAASQYGSSFELQNQSFNRYGYSVDITPDGTRIVAGAPGNAVRLLHNSNCKFLPDTYQAETSNTSAIPHTYIDRGSRGYNSDTPLFGAFGSDNYLNSISTLGWVRVIESKNGSWNADAQTETFYNPGDTLPNVYFSNTLTQTQFIGESSYDHWFSDNTSVTTGTPTVTVEGDNMYIGWMGNEYSNVNSPVGGVHVYARSTPGDYTSGWTYVQFIKSPTPLLGCKFGVGGHAGAGGVKVDGDTMVISAMGWDAAWRNLGGYQIHSHAGITSSMSLDYASQPVLFGAADGDLAGESVVVLDSGEALGAIGSGATAASIVGSPNGNGGTGCVDVYIWGEDSSTAITSTSLSDKVTTYGNQYTYGIPDPLLVNDTWQRVGATIVPPSDTYGQGNSQFGYSVAASSDGTTIAIGAPGVPGTYPYDGDGYGGSVYIYNWTGSVWDLEVRIRCPLGSGYNKNGNGNGRFGHSVSMSANGSRVVVGVPHYGSYPNTNGRVHVYGRVYAGSWTKMAEGVEQAGNGDLLTGVLDGSTNNQSTAEFGRSVSMTSDGNRIVVGAPGYVYSEPGNLGNQNPDNGCAVVYDFAGTPAKWNKGNTPFTSASIPHNTSSTSVSGGPSYGSKSGWSVAISGDGSRMVVGAPLYTSKYNSGYPDQVIGCAGVYTVATPSTSASAHTLLGDLIYDFIRQPPNPNAKRFEMGRDVAISDDGNRVAISGHYTAGETLTGNTVTNCGIVRTYHWSVEWYDQPPPIGTGPTPNGTFKWNRLGLKTRGNVGGKVPASSSGTHISQSAYELSSTEQGIYTNSYYGKSVSLSGTGHLLAVGCPGGYWSGNPTSAANGITPGWVRVFSNSSNGTRYSYQWAGNALSIPTESYTHDTALGVGKVYIYKRVTAGSPTSRWKLVQGVESSEIGSKGPGSRYYNETDFPLGEPIKRYAYDERFGWDIDLKDDHLIVSSDIATHGSSNPNTFWEHARTGQVYVFVRNTTGDRHSKWSWKRTIDPREGETWNNSIRVVNGVPVMARFGYSVVIDGDSTNGYTVAVGSPDRDTLSPSGTDVLLTAGAAFVFKGTGNTWVTQSYFDGSDALLPTDRVAEQNFGVSMSLDGDTLTVGATKYPPGTPTAGAVYVFVRSADDVWIQTSKLEDENWFTGFNTIVKGDTIYSLSRYPLDYLTALAANTTTSGAVHIYHRHNPGELDSEWFLHKTILPTTFPSTMASVPGIHNNTTVTGTVRNLTGMYHTNNSLYIGVDGSRTGANSATVDVTGVMEIRETDYYTRVSKESLGIPLVMGAEIHGYTEDMFIGNEYNPTTGYSGHVSSDTAFDFTATGTCVRISPDGTRIIVGSPRYSLDGTTLATHVGKIESWEWQDNLNAESARNASDNLVVRGSWNKYPNAIIGSNAGGRMGESFNLDYQGDRLAVLIKHPPREYTVKPTPHAGSLHVFDWSGTSWFETTEQVFFPDQIPFTGPIDRHPTLDPLNASDTMQFTVADDMVNDHFGDIAICSGDVVVSGCVDWTSSKVDSIQKYIGPPGAVESHFFTLAQNVRGNTVIGGYLSSDIMYVGTNDGSINTSTADEKRISFGGTYSSDNTYDSASIQNRIIYYDPSNRDPDQQGFSELLISKQFANSITNEGAVDQVRIKAAEFHVDEYVGSDTLLEQKPALTKNALGDFKINPEFIMPHESATANIKAKLDVAGDALIRRRLNAGYYPGNQLKGIEKLPWRIFFDTRDREIVKKITLTSNLFTGDTLTSNVVTQRVSPGGDWGRHDSIGNITWECAHRPAGGFIQLSNVASSVVTTGFNGMTNSDVKSADNKYVTKFSFWLQIPELHTSSTYQYVYTLAERAASDVSPTNNVPGTSHPANPSYNNGKVVKIKMAGSSPPSPIPPYSLLIEVPGTLGSWRVAGTLDSVIPSAQTGVFGGGNIEGFKPNTWYHIYAEVRSSYVLADQVIKVNNQALPLTLLSGSVSPYDAPGLLSVYDPVGSRIPGTLSSERSGTATDIDDTGDWLVVGGDASNIGRGKVGVYKYTSNGWKLQGNHIIATSDGDGFGSAVAISNSIPLINQAGNVYPGLAYPRVVVGMPNSDVNGPNSGMVKMFGWPSPDWIGALTPFPGPPSYRTTTDDWDQFGPTLTGSIDTLFGIQVDISNDGRFVAVSSTQGVHLYEWGGTPTATVSAPAFPDTTWLNYGLAAFNNILPGTGATEPPRLKFSNQGGHLVTSFGLSVEVNGGAGQIKVWQKGASNWQSGSPTQYGNTLSVSGRYAGHCVSISHDAQTIAFSVHTAGGGNHINDVRVYEYNAGTWVQKGATLTGVLNSEAFGLGSPSLGWNRRQIALTGVPSDLGGGARLIVGSPDYPDAVSNRGVVYIFNYISGSWVLDNITSTSAVGSHPGGSVTLTSSDYDSSSPLGFGVSVAGSNDGERIVVGELLNNIGGNESGVVTVYTPDKNIQHWVGDSRFSIGSYLDAETAVGIKMGNFAFETYDPFLESPSWTDPTTNRAIACAHPTCDDLYAHGSPSEKLVSGGDLRILNDLYVGQNITDGQLTTQNNPGIVPVFYVDNLTKRVGVNIDFPQESLHVVGNILATRKPSETSTFVKVFSEQSAGGVTNQSGYQIEAHSANGQQGIFKMFMTDDNQDVLNFVNELYPGTQPLTLWRNAVGINMSPYTARSGNWVNATSAMSTGYVLRVDGGVEINVPAGQLKIDNYGVKLGTYNSSAYFGFGDPNAAGWPNTTTTTFMNRSFINSAGYINAQGNITAGQNITAQNIVSGNRCNFSGNGSSITGFATTAWVGQYFAYKNHYHSDDRIKYNETLLTDHLTIINKLVPKRYEKIAEIPQGAVGTWIPTDEEWEDIKARESYHRITYVDSERSLQPIKDWYYESGFIAQELLADPVTSHLVLGEENTELTEYLFEDRYNDLSDEEKTEWTIVPDDERQDYWVEGEVHYKKTKLTQTPLRVDMQAISVASVGAIQELSSALDAEKAKNVELTERVHIMEQLYQGLLERVVQLESS
uniref:Peptidase S74 domain-containing protein n=1 Tax=Micromonas commoda virus TaxID=3057169 RepID=A0AAU7YR56_9PHYC